MMTFVYLIDEYPYDEVEHYWMDLIENAIGDRIYKYCLITYVSGYDNAYWRSCIVAFEKGSYLQDSLLLAVDSEIYINPEEASGQGADMAMEILLNKKLLLKIQGRIAVKYKYYIQRELKRLHNNFKNNMDHG